MIHARFFQQAYFFGGSTKQFQIPLPGKKHLTGMWIESKHKCFSTARRFNFLYSVNDFTMPQVHSVEGTNGNDGPVCTVKLPYVAIYLQEPR